MIFTRAPLFLVFRLLRRNKHTDLKEVIFAILEIWFIRVQTTKHTKFINSNQTEYNKNIWMDKNIFRKQSPRFFFYFHFQFFKHVAESAKIENLSKNKHKNTHTHTQVRAHVFLDSAQVEFNTKVKRK